LEICGCNRAQKTEYAGYMAMPRMEKPPATWIVVVPLVQYTIVRYSVLGNSSPTTRTMFASSKDGVWTYTYIYI
jgi:hypothetical protein